MISRANSPCLHRASVILWEKYKQRMSFQVARKFVKKMSQVKEDYRLRRVRNLS